MPPFTKFQNLTKLWTKWILWADKSFDFTNVLDCRNSAVLVARISTGNAEKWCVHIPVYNGSQLRNEARAREAPAHVSSTPVGEFEGLPIRIYRNDSTEQLPISLNTFRFGQRNQMTPRRLVVPNRLMSVGA